MPGYGTADAFLSHVQSESLADALLRWLSKHESDTLTVATLEDYCTIMQKKNLRFFVDYVGLRQCLSDFDLSKVTECIKTIGAVCVSLPVSPDVYLERSFCVFEVFSAVKTGAELEIVLHRNLTKRAGGSFCSGLATSKVNVLRAQTRNPEDKLKIDEYIKSVGVDKVNREVEKAIGDRVQQDTKKACIGLIDSYAMLEGL
eukprot:TRINITY_DN14050_c0_g1_i3.p1 TRINITY_DN14050_c0_g1~~TRINITY_DN14050_c0_g1_i3.p1  ORF type:complete len:201 (-),score=35.00 TRINITY_DN14050_c0_g1_i3:280-882(-)